MRRYRKCWPVRKQLLMNKMWKKDSEGGPKKKYCRLIISNYIDGACAELGSHQDIPDSVHSERLHTCSSSDCWEWLFTCFTPSLTFNIWTLIPQNIYLWSVEGIFLFLWKLYFWFDCSFVCNNCVWLWMSGFTQSSSFSALFMTNYFVCLTIRL